MVQILFNFFKMCKCCHMATLKQKMWIDVIKSWWLMSQWIAWNWLVMWMIKELFIQIWKVFPYNICSMQHKDAVKNTYGGIEFSKHQGILFPALPLCFTTTKGNLFIIHNYWVTMLENFLYNRSNAKYSMMINFFFSNIFTSKKCYHIPRR